MTGSSRRGHSNFGPRSPGPSELSPAPAGLLPLAEAVCLLRARRAVLASCQLPAREKDLGKGEKFVI